MQWNYTRLDIDSCGHSGRDNCQFYSGINVVNYVILFYSVLSLSGDMEDIPAALGFQKFKREPIGSGSCSALIKLLPGNQDLYVAQDTWTSYQDMIRVLKKYDFGYHTTSTGKSK